MEENVYMNSIVTLKKGSDFQALLEISRNSTIMSTRADIRYNRLIPQ